MKQVILHIAVHFNSIPFDEKHLKACVECLRNDFKMDRREIHGYIRLLLTNSEIGPDFYPMLITLDKSRVLERLEVWYNYYNEAI